MKISFFILYVGANAQLTVNTRFNGELRLALNQFLVSFIQYSKNISYKNDAHHWKFYVSTLEIYVTLPTYDMLHILDDLHQLTFIKELAQCFDRAARRK